MSWDCEDDKAPLSITIQELRQVRKSPKARCFTSGLCPNLGEFWIPESQILDSNIKRNGRSGWVELPYWKAAELGL